ncbi:Staphylococcal nuclease-like protein [anaerobic digester metagenome]
MRSIILSILCILYSFPAMAWMGTVLTVHDGDTVRVQSIDGEAVSIRVYGVDCPELGQPYGAEARDMTTQLVNGQRVEIVPAQKVKSYKREVAVVVLADGTTLEDALVRAGLAWVDGRYCKRPECNQWRQHQTDAAAASPPRGLWADSVPLPPWQWRKLKKTYAR